MDQPESELLQRAFVKHCNVLHWKSDSGLSPQMILAVNIWIDRVSPTMHFAETEAELEDFEMEWSFLYLLLIFTAT